MSLDIDISTDFNVLDSFLDSAESNQNGVVIFDTPYALYVEYPTEYTDKKPPFEPLFEWVRRNINTDDPEGTTYRIQQYIFENGTEGVFFLNRTKTNYENTEIENIIRGYNGEIENAPENIMENILNGIAEDSTEIVRDEAFDTGKLADSVIIELSEDSDLIE